MTGPRRFRDNGLFFARVVAGGARITGPWRDGTVKITVAGLQPGRDYHCRFVAPDGGFSPVGRTRTLPADGTRPWRAAVFSCSNMGYGWFNAYAHAARRDDLDCAIHLGDYFYGYGPDHYPPAKDAVPGRVPQPLSETVLRETSPAIQAVAIHNTVNSPRAVEQVSLVQHAPGRLRHQQARVRKRRRSLTLRLAAWPPLV